LNFFFFLFFFLCTGRHIISQDYDVTLYTQMSLYAIRDIYGSGTDDAARSLASPFTLVVFDGVLNKSIFPLLPSPGISLSTAARGVVGGFVCLSYYIEFCQSLYFIVFLHFINLKNNIILFICRTASSAAVSCNPLIPMSVFYGRSIVSIKFVI
jgi:hypothetical protein